MVATPRDGEACTHYNGFTLEFKTTSIAQLHQVLNAALTHGGVAIEDPPGWCKAPAMTVTKPKCGTRQATSCV
ncbi:MAG: hypothetical protein ACN6NT_07860 [Comamonas sp.]